MSMWSSCSPRANRRRARHTRNRCHRTHRHLVRALSRTTDLHWRAVLLAQLAGCCHELSIAAATSCAPLDQVRGHMRCMWLYTALADAEETRVSSGDARPVARWDALERHCGVALDRIATPGGGQHHHGDAYLDLARALVLADLAPDGVVDVLTTLAATHLTPTGRHAAL